MAIQLNGAIVSSETFTIGNKNIKAVYTPETDQEFSNLLVDLEALQKRVDDDEVTDKMTVDQKKKFINDTDNEIVKMSEKYIKSVFSKDDADFAIKECGGRVTNIARVASIVFNAGTEKQKVNRKQRRHDDK